MKDKKMKGILTPSALIFGLLGSLTFPQIVLAEEGEEDWLEPSAIQHLRTNTGYVLSAKELEINLIFDYSNDDFMNSLESRISLEYGVFPGFMMEVEIPVIRNSFSTGRRNTGFGDIEIEGKFHLFEKGNMNSAFGVGLGIPTGSEAKGLGGEDFELEFFWATSFTFDKFSAHAEIGTEFDIGESPDGVLANFALVVPDSRRPILYQFATHIEIEGGLTTAEFIPGFQFKLFGQKKEGVGVGVGFPIGVTKGAPNWGAIVKLELGF